MTNLYIEVNTVFLNVTLFICAALACFAIYLQIKERSEELKDEEE